MIYTLQTAAIQLGFVVGSILGSFIMQLAGFTAMGIVLGGILVLCSPIMLFNRNLPAGSGTRPKRTFRFPADPQEEVALIQTNPLGNPGSSHTSSKSGTGSTPAAVMQC